MKPSLPAMILSLASCATIMLSCDRTQQAGDIGQPCYGNGTCDGELVCDRDELCNTPEPESACPDGKLRTVYTSGNCCWQGQGWAGKCVGTPTECPKGTELHKEENTCTAVTCGGGRVRDRDGIHCCHPGQQWSDSLKKCKGAPTRCEGDLKRRDEDCLCPPGEVVSKANATTCVAAPAEMVHVPAGWFTMGRNDGDESARPAREVYISDFYIDRHEVTVKQYRWCVLKGVCGRPSKRHSTNGRRYNYEAPDRDDHPVNGVSWHQASAYCDHVGGRLPTEAEWEKAARGKDKRRYPWGDDAPSCKVAVMFEIGRGSGCGTEGTLPVGSKPAGASPYGVLDLIGGVNEWTLDFYAEDTYSRASARDPRGPQRGKAHVVRGGAWYAEAQFLSATRRVADRADYASFGSGFRCVRAAK